MGWFRKRTESVTVDERLSHIAFIMDGNGRWAKKRALPRSAGHIAGAEACERVFRYCQKIGIKTVTVYAFSTENWNRPQEEVEGLMKLFNKQLDRLIDRFEKNDARYIFLGDKAPFTEELRAKMLWLEEKSQARGSDYTLNLAINYGARDELIHAFSALVAEGKTAITEADVAAHLYTKDSPDPDLIVRTGGEYRLSNFLLWQASYAELMTLDCYWPDMNEKRVDEIVRNFYERERRFGKVT